MRVNHERRLKGRVAAPYGAWAIIRTEDGELVNADAGQLSKVLEGDDGTDRRRESPV